MSRRGKGRGAVALHCLGHIAQKKEENGEKGRERCAATLALFWWLSTKKGGEQQEKVHEQNERRRSTAALRIMDEQVR